TFVRALYQQVIGRPPGPQDPIPLLDQIASTQAGRQALASGLLHSVPYDKILVDGYFTTFLGRPPANAAEENAYIGLLQPPLNFRDEFVLGILAGSAEAVKFSGNSAVGWLSGLYPKLLNRPADAASFNPSLSFLFNDFNYILQRQNT